MAPGVGIGLSRLRKENTDLRRTLVLCKEVILQRARENDALLGGATVVALHTRTMSASPAPS